MWSCTPGASSSSSPFSAGPSTPYSTEPSGSSSSSPTRPSSSKPKSVKRTSKPRKATKPSKANAPSPMPKPALAVEVWRDIFLEAFPILSTIVDDWYSAGSWNGPVCDSVHLSASESEDEAEAECCSAPKSKSAATKGKGKGKSEPRCRSTPRSGGSFWKVVTTHCNSLDVDAVRTADSRIIHAFLGSICVPRDVLLCGTQFSGVFYPRCACHSKAKTGDSLRIALESVGLLDFNVRELDRLIFVVEMNNRWFVVLVTPQWVVVYDPAGFSRLEPDTVSQVCTCAQRRLTHLLADYVADAFLADAVRWPDLDDVPDILETRIISPDNPIDPMGSAVLVCGAIELMVALPTLDELHYPGLEVSLWFLSESIHKDLTHEHYRRLLTIAFKEVEGQTKKEDKAETATAPTRPRVNAPKVPFKAKRRVKRKTPIVQTGSLAKHEVSPELATALQAAGKKSMRGSKLDKVLLDRVVWTCNSGHLPGDDGCACDFAEYCHDLFAGLGLDRSLLASLGLPTHRDGDVD